VKDAFGSHTGIRRGIRPWSSAGRKEDEPHERAGKAASGQEKRRPVEVASGKATLLEFYDTTCQAVIAAFQKATITAI
jgi:hypothetical protein